MVCFSLAAVGSIEWDDLRMTFATYSNLFNLRAHPWIKNLKVEAMVNQLAEEKRKADDLTEEKAEIERELELLEGRITKSKADVAY